MAGTMNPGVNIEANLGDVSGQVAFGNYNVQVHADHGAIVNIAPPDRQPMPRPRPSPVLLRPRRFPGLVDRADETGAAQIAFRDGAPVELYGEAGLGKTALLRYLAYEGDTTPLPDGVVYLSGRSQPAADLLQSLFDAFYECDVPFKPTDAQLRHYLQGKRSLILVDDVELGREELEGVIGVVASASVAAASTERHLWGENRSIDIRGLHVSDALLLVEREMGRPLAEEERAAARDLCEALQGHPLRILQAVAAAREDHRSLAGLPHHVTDGRAVESVSGQALASLPESERQLLGALAALNGAPCQASHLAALAGLTDAQPPLDRLQARRLIAIQDGRYLLAADLLKLLRSEWDLTVWRERALEYFTEWAQTHKAEPARIAEESGAIRAILEWAASAGRWAGAIRLGRSVENALTLTGRWGGSSLVLSLVLNSARAEGHSSAHEAWALHQIGSRALCLDDKAAAMTYLSQALEMRQSLGDVAGAAITRHNLDLLLASGGPQKKEQRQPAQHAALRLLKWAALPIAALVGVAIYLFFARDAPPSGGLTGTGVAPAAARLTLNADPLRFVAEPGGESAPQIATLTNEGQSPITISRVAMEGPDAGDFAASGCSGQTLSPTEHCEITVTFRSPKSPKPGSYDASLVITAEGQSATTHLVGTALPPEQGSGIAAAIKVDPSNIDFDLQAGQRGEPKSVTVYSVGSAPLKISPPLNADSVFRMKTDCGNALPRGEQCRIVVYCDTGKAGNYSSTLVISSNASNGKQTILLRALIHERPKPPLITLDPNPLSFENTEVGSKSQKPATIGNKGGSPLTIDSVTVASVGAKTFAVSRNCNNARLAPGSACEVVVTFVPGAAGPSQATLTVTDRVDGLSQSIRLAGKGVQNRPPEGYCCTSSVFKSSPEVCKEQSGDFFKTEPEATRRCEQKKQPPKGYCCIGGNILKGFTSAECARRQGVYFDDPIAATLGCRKVEPKTDWCCLPGGALQEGMTPAQCREGKGAFLKSMTRDDAKAHCQPPPR